MSEEMRDTSHMTESTLGTSTTPDASKMFDAAAREGSERYSAAREKLREHWAVAKDDLDQLKQKAMTYSQTAARATNTFAHDHPWTTAGAAVGVGALIGWLMTRRTDLPRSSRS